MYLQREIHAKKSGRCCKGLGKKRIISIGALYEKEQAHDNWKYQTDHIAFTTGQITEIIESIK